MAALQAEVERLKAELAARGGWWHQCAMLRQPAWYGTPLCWSPVAEVAGTAGLMANSPWLRLPTRPAGAELEQERAKAKMAQSKALELGELGPLPPLLVQPI